MSGDRVPLSPGVLILGGAAVVLMLVMLVGFLLPTDWEARATAVVDAPQETIFTYLDSPEGWRAWTPWPDSSVVRSGPPHGTGAELSWDDDELGSGSFRLVEVTPSRRVRYEVEVGGGAMRTTGTVTLLSSTDGSGVLVSWRENGNLGRNPLMGFWVFFMGRAQSAELEKGLGRLVALAVEGPYAGQRLDLTEAAAGPVGDPPDPSGRR
jgi:uncharacterized protein YndB with AHSA1/START domain